MAGEQFFSRNVVFGGGFAAGVLAGTLAAAAYHLSRRERKPRQEDSSKILDNLFEDLENHFHVSTLKLQQLFQAFNAEIKKGLRGSRSSLLTLPSYVDSLPTGEEKGAFLAFDLGSSLFRIMRVFLEGQGSFRVEQKSFEIPTTLKSQPTEQLFDFMAEATTNFLTEHSIDQGTPFEAGLAFSFPVEHQSLASGTLLEWTKGYALSGAVGKDPALLLNQALRRKNLNIQVRSLVNDAVGALVTRHYADPQCFMSIILGSGTNAAYVERAAEVKRLGISNPAGPMVVSLEWGGFDPTKRHLPATCYDLQLDRESANPGRQTFEKMVSGLYLGEIVRLVCADLIEKNQLFGGQGSEAFLTPNSLSTLHLSRVERDHSRALQDTSTLLTEVMGIREPDLASRQIFKRICELVGIRAARLLAAAVAAVVAKMDKLGGCSVAIEGSVFRDYPHFKSRVMDALTEIFGLQAENILLIETPEGAGVGAALTASAGPKS